MYKAMRGLLGVVLGLNLLALSPTASSAQAPAGYLSEEQQGGRRFTEIEIGDRTVYFHQRMIGEAQVERDFIVYQFEKDSGELIKQRTFWREDLPDRLPPLGIDAQDAMETVGPHAVSARLIYISPESDVFPLSPAPRDPCWVVRDVNGDHLRLVILNAVSGEYLGDGIVPPHNAYAMTGPQASNPCEGAWEDWSENAASWFNYMGYSSQHAIWPTREALQDQVQSDGTALFYELAHGGSSGFVSGCQDGDWYEFTTAQDIEFWIEEYEKMPFAFLGSCGGMCDTGPGTLSDTFRKASSDDASTVGYCGMAEEQCNDCWPVSLLWQDAFFSYLADGYTVESAFNLADADYPQCAAGACMRLAGDDDLRLVPAVFRTEQNDPILHADFTTELQPGVLHGFLLGPASDFKAYLPEISPLDDIAAGLERVFVQPEYDGERWNDVLRIMIREQDPPLRVNVRVYQTGGFTCGRQFTTQLEPGVLHGFLLGSSSDDRTYVPELSPVDAVVAGLERVFVQPEFFNDHWYDVLRLQTRPQDPSLDVSVRVYDTTDMPVLSEFTWQLDPGVLHGFSLGPSQEERCYLPEITPLGQGVVGFETIMVNPEFNGQQWNDVLRVQTRPTDPPLEVQIRIHLVAEPPFSAVDIHGPRESGLGPILGPNHPNPLGSTTSLTFALPQAGMVDLEVLGIDGRCIRSLCRREFPAGAHTVAWDARDDQGRRVPTGVYVCRLRVGGQQASRPVVVVH